MLGLSNDISFVELFLLEVGLIGQKEKPLIYGYNIDFLKLYQEESARFASTS